MTDKEPRRFSHIFRRPDESGPDTVGLLNKLRSGSRASTFLKASPVLLAAFMMGCTNMTPRGENQIFRSIGRGVEGAAEQFVFDIWGCKRGQRGCRAMARGTGRAVGDMAKGGFNGIFGRDERGRPSKKLKQQRGTGVQYQVIQNQNGSFGIPMGGGNYVYAPPLPAGYSPEDCTLTIKQNGSKQIYGTGVEKGANYTAGGTWKCRRR